jgi:hypothetical protein
MARPTPRKRRRSASRLRSPKKRPPTSLGFAVSKPTCQMLSCHAERSRPESAANRSAQSKGPMPPESANGVERSFHHPALTLHRVQLKGSTEVSNGLYGINARRRTDRSDPVPDKGTAPSVSTLSRRTRAAAAPFCTGLVHLLALVLGQHRSADQTQSNRDGKNHRNDEDEFPRQDGDGGEAEGKYPGGDAEAGQSVWGKAAELPG